MYSLIGTAKFNDVDRQARLADVLARIAGHPASRLDQLLPRNWTMANAAVAAATGQKGGSATRLWGVPEGD